MSTGQPVIKSEAMKPDLCLEFANTRYWRGQAEPTETLNAAEDHTTGRTGAEVLQVL